MSIICSDSVSLVSNIVLEMWAVAAIKRRNSIIIYVPNSRESTLTPRVAGVDEVGVGPYYCYFESFSFISE